MTRFECSICHAEVICGYAVASPTDGLLTDSIVCLLCIRVALLMAGLIDDLA
jgi:hypothetical protein